MVATVGLPGRLDAALVVEDDRPLDAIGDGEGQSVVEMALTLPVLLVTLLGAFEGVRMLAATVALSTAVLAGAQFGAQSAATSADTAGIVAAVQQELTLAGQTGTVTVTSSTTTDADGEKLVSVSASYAWRSLLAYPALPQAVTIARSATLQVRR